MEEVVAVLDVLLTLGPSFCLCFAAAIVLQRRDLILATSNQTTLLLTFSRLNSEVQPIDVPACLDRAFHLYAKTPGGLLRPWDQQQLQQQQQAGRPSLSSTVSPPQQQAASSSSLSSASVLMWQEQKKGHHASNTNGSNQEDKENSNDNICKGNSKGLPRQASFIALPHVLDHVARLTAQDLQELEEAFREEEEEEEDRQQLGNNTEQKETKEEEERKKEGVVLIDVREITMDEYYAPKPLPGVPAGIRRVRLPFSSVQGHVDFCRPLRTIQKEMRPPAAMKPFIGRAHIVVHGGEGGERRAEDVARMLVLCKVPFVSVAASF
jgi:rhodanese-related sulfurtransferase